MALFHNLAAASDGDCVMNVTSLKMKDSIIITELKLWVALVKGWAQKLQMNLCVL